MIIYISELRPDLLDTDCEKLYLIVDKVRQSNLKKLVIAGAADFSHASRLVVDLSSLKDTNEEIGEALGAFRAMYPDTRVIVIADREPQGSPLFTRLVKSGVYDIVTGLDGGELRICLTSGMTKEDAERRLTSPRSNDSDAPEAATPSSSTLPTLPGLIPAAPVTSVQADPLPVREAITANREFKKHKPFITVAVCSTEAHIGATHHALLVTKFLSGVGFKACYLEANGRRGVLYLARAYPVNANERKHFLQYDGVDMVFDFKLAEVINAGYDFYVFDLGRFAEVEPATVLTKEVKLVVGGSKAWEMEAYTPVLEALDGCRDLRFILNHAPPGEQSSLRPLLGGHTAHFSDYAPYPFAFGVNLGMYKEIFGDYVHVTQTTAGAPDPARRKGLFGRG